MPVVVDVLVDLVPNAVSHAATVAALHHAAAATGIDADVRVVPTDQVDDDLADTDLADAVVVGPGSPYRRPDRAEAVIRSARQRGVPLVAT